nr:murein transglycosylase A [Desulfobulbaceae bacterium]
MKNYKHLSVYSALLCLLIVGGCAKIVTKPYERCRVRVLTPSAITRLPLFVDGDYSSLATALGRSIDALRLRPQAEMISACGKEYTVAEQLTTLIDFQQLLWLTDDGSLNQSVWDSFTVCEVLNSQGEPELLATGYFQPYFKASRTFNPPYIYPLYKRPADLVQYNEGIDGKTVSAVGRLSDGGYVPYWSRREIETEKLLAGQELLFLADPVDAFVLHVQGSGLAELEDGTVLQVLFDGSNGRAYRSIGRLLVDEGRLSLAEVTLPKIRRYLQEHLDDRQRILHYNERYIFFRTAELENQSGPIGSMGSVLTPERSIALDNSCYPIGGLFFMESTKPLLASNQEVLGWDSFSRFVVHQDTGAAITGSGRLDFFWGSGEYAQAAAGVMKQPARLYMIVGK